MLFSNHVSQALLASLSLLSFPVALAKPIATTSAPAGLETTSLDVWRPLEGWDSGPAALATRQNGGAAWQRKWQIVTVSSSVALFPLTTMGTVVGCQQYGDEKTVKNGALCVGAAIATTLSLINGVIQSALYVRGVIFVFEQRYSLDARSESDFFLSIDNSKRATPSPAIEASLIDI